MRDHIIRSAVVVGMVAAALGGGSVMAAAHTPRAHTPRAHVRRGTAPPAIRLHRVRRAAQGRRLILRPGSPRAAGTSTANLAYHGGAVQRAPAVFVLFWGSWWRSSCSASAGNGAADEEYLYSYFHALGGPADGWSPITSQYTDKLGHAPAFPRGVWGGWAADCADPPQSATSQQLADEAGAYAQYLASRGTPIGGNTQIIVVSPSGANPGGGFGTSYCAWHSWSTYNGSNYSYTNLPYLPDQGSKCGAGLVNGSLDTWSVVGGREFANAVTDPFGNAWKGTAGTEIGSKCTGVLFPQALGGQSYAQQSLWDNHTSSCRRAATIPDTITASPVPAQTSAVGATASVQLKASSSKGFSLRFSATGLPSGLSVSAGGLISGKLLWPGDYAVAVKVTDPVSAAAHISFSWRVLPPAGAIKSYPHPAHCVMDYRASLVSGTPLDMEACDGSLAQQWAAFPSHTLHRYGGPAHINTSRCLTAARLVNGARIDLAACAGTPGQFWVYQPTSHEWVNPASGKCLTDPAGHLANGTQLVLETCTGGSAQEWTNV